MTSPTRQSLLQALHQIQTASRYSATKVQGVAPLPRVAEASTYQHQTRSNTNGRVFNSRKLLLKHQENKLSKEKLVLSTFRTWVQRDLERWHIYRPYEMTVWIICIAQSSYINFKPRSNINNQFNSQHIQIFNTGGSCQWYFKHGVDILYIDKHQKIHTRVVCMTV